MWKIWLLAVLATLSLQADEYASKVKTSVVGHYVLLSWHWTNTGGVATNFRIRRRLINGPFTVVATPPVSSGTTYTDRTISLHNSFCYTVSAYGPKGESKQTVPICVKVP